MLIKQKLVQENDSRKTNASVAKLTITTEDQEAQAISTRITHTTNKTAKKPLQSTKAIQKSLNHHK